MAEKNQEEMEKFWRKISIHNAGKKRKPMLSK